MARARKRVSQCAVPVGTVKADGKVMIWAFWRLSARLISGNRSYSTMVSRSVWRMKCTDETHIEAHC